MKSDVCILHEIKNSLQEKKQTILQLLGDMNYRINEVWSKQERILNIHWLVVQILFFI